MTILHFQKLLPKHEGLYAQTFHHQQFHFCLKTHEKTEVKE